MKFAVNKIIDGKLVPIVLTDEEVNSIMDYASKLLNVDDRGKFGKSNRSDTNLGKTYNTKVSLNKDKIESFIKANDKYFGGNITARQGADALGICMKTYRKYRDALLPDLSAIRPTNSPINEEKKVDIKKMILKFDPIFGGNMLVKNVVKMSGVSSGTYYKLRNEVVKAIAA